MLKIGFYSAKLFLQGKLIRDPAYFIRQTTIGVSIGLLSLLLLVQIATPLCIPITVSSLVTGMVMPFLLKDFKTK
ncbi:hypothetical protein [Nostoc sp. FACHB-110]|uniref:hypothetical protein n=1 Tax=Nostoc sp. FACHB-110 TaxID=2692834 RepID=UPI0016823D1E|nr:hypothetical protein [Nostoc sp. FACHB-110]MBD2440212.1 hypothetical protein [Nostoc sp. FACHB-110]